MYGGILPSAPYVQDKLFQHIPLNISTAEKNKKQYVYMKFMIVMINLSTSQFFYAMNSS